LKKYRASTPKTRDEGTGSGSGTASIRVNKRKKFVKKGGLSFGNDDDDEEPDSNSIATKSKNHSAATSTAATPRSATPSELSDDTSGTPKRRLGPNASLSIAPKALTKSALLKEAATRESLRREFLNIQEAVKGTTIAVPFVFYDGTNIPGGVCKIKKGDHIWLFLDKSRKVGAELGVGGEKAKATREWARVGVDDLMLVRGEIIVPHVSLEWR
jgi:protein FAM50